MVNFFNLILGIALILLGGIVLYASWVGITEGKVDKYGADIKGFVGGGGLFVSGLILILKEIL